MRNYMLVLIGIFFAASASAIDEPRSYSEAAKSWSQTKTRKDYIPYLTEFTQFNNRYHLDEKDGCYGMQAGIVNLLLVITRPANSDYSVISGVFSDVDNDRSRCFKRTYTGLKTRIPPYLPFVLQMTMGAVAT